MSTGDKGASEVLGDLQSKGDYFTKLSVVEKKRLIDLKDAMAYISAETDKYRTQAKQVAIQVMNLHVLTPNPAYSRADGVDVGRQARQVTMKALNILEWKLNKLLQRKSECMIEIKKLKQEIDHYRRLRLQTDISHVKYEEKLRVTKEKIEQYLGESSAVVEEREACLVKKEQLEQINIEEQKIFAAEYEELGIFIKEQNDALELALLNERKADRNDTKGKSDTAASNDPSLDSLKCDLTLEEEVAMAKHIGTLSKFVATESNSLSGVQSRIKSYEQMFEQLKKMTNTSSMEEVVSTYVAQEEEMFSLYNFIQAVNTEIDNVVETTNQISVDIEKFKEEQKEQEESKIHVLEELQRKLDSVKDSTKSADEKNKTLTESLALVNKKVQSIFFKLQCDQVDGKGSNNNPSTQKSKGVTMSRPESKVALLAGHSVSDSNVLEFMACIEQRAVDIIFSYLRSMTEHERSRRGAPKSPTPGPLTMSLFHDDSHPSKYKAAIDFSELETDDLLLIDHTTPVALATATPSHTAALPAIDEDKPVDLSIFKEKLGKKLGLDQSMKRRSTQ